MVFDHVVMSMQLSLDVVFPYLSVCCCYLQKTLLRTSHLMSSSQNQSLKTNHLKHCLSSLKNSQLNVSEMFISNSYVVFVSQHTMLVTTNRKSLINTISIVEELLYRLRYGLLATIFIPCAHSVSMGGNGDFEK